MSCKLHSTLGALVVLTLTMPCGEARAQFICGNEQDSVAVTEEYPCPDETSVLLPIQPFIRHRPGSPGTIRYRDLEFFWFADGTYGSVPAAELLPTLNKFAGSLSDSTGRNPLGINAWDFHLIYDYFRRVPTPYNSLNPFDTTSVVLGKEGNEGLHPYTEYNSADRSHVDAYIMDPEAIAAGGQYPAQRMAADEDVSTGYDEDPCQVRHGNSIDLEGPPVASAVDLDGTGWTRPDALHNTGFDHEFQHSIPGQGSGIVSEFFSAGAEVIGGLPPVVATGEFPYTWSLMAGNGPVSCTNIRASDSNYHARTAFMGYLAYNFRGLDTTTTVSAIEDDLMRLWVKSGTSLLRGLQDQLGDAACTDCSGFNYFHPGGAALPNADRFSLLLHNWRVANYVNNSTLEEGQYGYPPQFGFSPAAQLRAWQEFDNCSEDDVIAIPAEVSIKRAQAMRETTFVRERAYHGSTFPMALQMFGSEYWLLRADPGAFTAGQDLIVRVSPRGIHRFEQGPFGPPVNACEDPPTLSKSARLLASVVTYSVPAGQENAPLWQHPEWARLAMAPRWVDVDSVAGDLEFVVSSFGDSVKAALVVITLADGPGQTYVGASGLTGLSYSESLRYRLSAALRRWPAGGPAPTAEIAAAGTIDEQPVWSPPSDSLLFVRTSTGVAPKLYRKRVGTGGVAQIFSGAPAAERQTEPVWSPRGDYVAFTKLPVGEAESEVWVYNLRTGTDLRKLVTLSGAESSPAFQPNGQRLAYLWNFASGDTIVEIHRIRLDGTQTGVLYRRYGTQAIRSLRWSPDGRWVYVLVNDSLYAIGAEGAVSGQVVSRPNLIPGCSSFDLPTGNGPLVSAETTPVPYLRECYFFCMGACNGQPSVTALMDRKRIALSDTIHADTLARFYAGGAEFADPRWSPDGTRLAYSSNQNLTSDRDVFIGRVSYNQPPVLHDVAAFHFLDIYAHIPFSWDFHTTDGDGEKVTFAAVHLPDSATFQPDSGIFRWPNPKKAGSDSLFYIVFRALDPSGGVHSYVTCFRVKPVAPSGGGCPFADVRTADGWVTENSILGRSPSGEPAFDAYRLRQTPEVGDGRVRLRLRENEREITTLDQLRLVTVDRSAALAAVAGEGEIHTGVRVSAFRIATPAGIDVTALVNGGGWLGVPGDTLLVEFDPPGRTGFGLTGTLDGGVGGGDGLGKEDYLRYEPGGAGGPSALEPRATPASLTDAEVLEGTGIVIQAPDDNGGWQEVAHWYPRAHGDARVFPALTHPRARLIFVGSHRLTWFGRLKPAVGTATQTVLEPLVATHSRLGDVKVEVEAGGGSTLLAPGDTVSVEFAVPPAVEGLVRDYFLVTRGVYTSLAGTARLEPGGKALPLRHALLPNVPNPFSAVTTLRFELPRAERVRLEVFDLSGRRVRTLADGEWSAGTHALDWDRSGNDGRRLGAGVYLYRLTAGGFRAHRKMVIGAR